MKFILFGSGRSGSTLLTSLLNSHPDVYCDSEVLSEKVVPNLLFPKAYLNAIYRKAPYRNKHVYGCGVMSYQLLYHKRIKDIEFLKDLYNSGWRFLHIRRDNLLKVILSILTAQKDNIWELKDSTSNYKESGIYVAKDQLLHYIRVHQNLYRLEDSFLASIDHFPIRYERDLESGNWQVLMDKIFGFLNLQSYPVSTSLKKKSGRSIEERIINYEEIKPILIDNNLV